jgi:hypothetical protein
VEVFWWNNGRKTLDFRGTKGGFFKVKGIKWRKIKDGYRFHISVSGTSVKMECLDPNQGVKDAIRIFLVMMGDRTTVNGCRINW